MINRLDLNLIMLGVPVRIELLLKISSLLIISNLASATELSWDSPHDSLLTQTACPVDSTVDAMVVQKETLYRIESKGKYRVVIFVKKRLKIYTEAGLEYADFTLPYYHYQKVGDIKATCYNFNEGKVNLDKDDVHEEMWVMDKKKDIRVDAKSFAVPGAKAGSVIDISYELSQKYVVFIPPYVFQENIPVGIAEVRVMIPDYYHYEYFIVNPDLIHVNAVKRDENPVLIATAENIPALEDELLRPPIYNISTRMWLKLNKYEGPYYSVRLASSWQSLLEYYEVPQTYRECIKNSGNVNELVNEIIGNNTNKDTIITRLFYKVRDDWEVRLYPSVYKPLGNVDEILKMETLDAESKATLLCSMLRRAGIDSDVLLICSRDDGLRDFPSFFIFDHALTYVPSLDIYLDPSDPGAEVNVIDIDYHDKLALNITSFQNGFSYTPKYKWSNGSLADMNLYIDESGNLLGEGHITFHCQKAIEARREVRKLSDQEEKEWLNDLLFSDLKDAVDSLSISPDSMQSAETFRIDFTIESDNYISLNDDYPEIYIFPGNSFGEGQMDKKPPRKYPVYYGLSNNDYYKVVWDFGEKFKPKSWEDIAFKDGLSVIGSFATEYNHSTNSLTVIRQYKNLSAIYRAGYSEKIEDIKINLKEYDKTSLILQRK